MDLRVMAVSRLMLDNVPHIKAYWIMLGIGTAQVALAYGADDIDGTVRHELIYHDAGATTPEVLSVEAIRRLIATAHGDNMFNRRQHTASLSNGFFADALGLSKRTDSLDLTICAGVCPTKSFKERVRCG